MSSLRNAVQRRNHKERGQPFARQKYGLLEKHKDYVLRARDYHSKQTRLKRLREKAYFRNPDEFYFKMINSKTENGVHVLERNKAFADDEIKLLKSQDLNYIKALRNHGKRIIERLQTEPHIVKDAKAKPKHIIFVDTLDDVESIDPSKYLSEQSGETHDNKEGKESRKQKELAARVKRDDRLAKIERELTMQKHLAGKGRRKKVGSDGNGLPVFKWKFDRKK